MMPTTPNAPNAPAATAGPASPAGSTAEVAALAGTWRLHGAALAVVLAVILLLYRDTATTMVGIWMRSETFAHAFVVPPISLWLAWRLRANLRLLRPQAVPWLALPLAGLALVWWLGELVSTNSVTQLMLMAMLVTSVPAILGWQVARLLMFPLGFMFFAVPVGEFLTPMLIQYTADFTVTALRLSGIPVFREGNQFVIPSGRWSVVEACSGIRYLMASLMAGCLFAYINYRSLSKRWLFVGVAILVPIVANWLRAYLIVMLGHLSDNRIATGVDHLLYGWLFFGVVIMAMFWIGARWAEADAPPPQDTGAGLVATRRSSPGWLTAGVVAVLLAVAVPPVLVARQTAQAASGAAPLGALVLPTELPGGWQASPVPVADWSPRMQNPSAAVQRNYQRDGAPAGLYVAWFQDQQADRKLVTSENMLVTSQDKSWNLVATGQQQVSGPQGPMVVRSAELLGASATLSGSKPKLRVWQLYWVGDRFTHSDLQAKLYQALQVMRGQGDGGAMLVLYTADQGPAEADARLQALLSAATPSLESQLRAMRTP